ncbi:MULTISPECIES: NAD(P)H-binding protein [Myxococcus]|uniref:NAD(P)H-binding protein n=1 Tax=Myxococcus TaxID=32 RepID=UPI00112C6185|nr:MULTISPECIES: NAD(P)H-binding protein [Myxococcus]QDF07701.1 epimerase [Myxococcus xanthus]WAM25320.1 NAD(P)H-binding protein [Myxococcus sp. NMCA1]
MRVILFGATGMVGQGVLRECLFAPDVERVLTVGRGATGQRHEKLTELVHTDLQDFSAVAEQLTGYDVCIFSLGVSSAGMTEQAYRRVTFDLTLAAAQALGQYNPGMRFLYVSGAGTDSSERGRTMWARVKGETENTLLRQSTLSAYMFRPGYIQPMHGIRSKTRLYQALYTVMAPLYPVWKALFPTFVTTTEQLGRAMLAVARQGASKRVLENRDINDLAAAAS